MVALIGKKIGMISVFQDNGALIPVTLIEITNNIITFIKTVKKDGYKAVQVTTGLKKKANRSQLIFFNKLNIKLGLGLWELPYVKSLHCNIGQPLNVDLFKNIKKVNITAICKGKGFSGTIKRWNFRSQDKSHGNSLSHRVPGSIGQNQTPGKVFKGKKMPGHMGNKKVTIKNLSLIEVNTKHNFLLVKGCIPGANNSIVRVSSSVR